MKHNLAHCYPTNSSLARGACVALVLVLATGNALASTADEYLFIPTVTQGERELDWHFGSGSSGDTARGSSITGLGYGVGVTQHWFTELDIEYRRHSSVGTGLDSLEWENTLQIGEPGQWPVDLGMVFNLEKPYEASRNSFKTEGTSIRFGPLLQKDIGKVELNFNLLVTRYFKSTEFSATEFSYQSQIKYRYSQPLEVGIQAFGKFSSVGQTWAPYSDQVQRVGPVVLGRLVMPQERSLSYNLALLIGTTDHSSDRTLRFQVEYEF
jgi:hypothetical protein